MFRQQKKEEVKKKKKRKTLRYLLENLREHLIDFRYHEIYDNESLFL